MRTRAPLLAFGLLAAALAACATPAVRHRDWSGYAGPGADFHAEEVEFPHVATGSSPRTASPPG